ncbi:MAG: hypothetical protein GY835_18835 [bacterium]|nr:hypothetical protein [bacterium]
MIVRGALLVAFSAFVTVSAFAQIHSPSFDNPLGYVYQPGPEGEEQKPPMGILKSAGIGWVRLDAKWRFMEPQQGQYYWDEMDWQIDWAEELGMRVLMEIGIFIPSWANGTDPDCDLWGGECSLPPTDPSYYTDWVTQVVSRYAGRVDAWSNWREANYDIFWGGTGTEFINQIVCPGYNAIKAIDPNTPVVAANTLNASSLFERVMNEACNCLDIAGVHYYEEPTTTQMAENMFASMEQTYLPLVRSHCPKAEPLWITETGVRSNEIGSEELHGFEVIETFSGALDRDWVDKVFHYRLHDHEMQPHEWGLVKNRNFDYAVKEAYFVVRDWALSLYQELIVTIDADFPNFLVLMQGPGSVGYSPSEVVVTGIPWGFPGSSPADNKWNAENDAVNGNLEGFNIFSSHSHYEDAPEIGVTVSGLQSGATYEVFVRYGTTVSDPDSRGVVARIGANPPQTFDQNTTTKEVLRAWGNWQEWEALLGEGVVSNGELTVYLDDDDVESAVWSGLRLKSTLNSDLAFVFADGFESGDVSAWAEIVQ